MTELHLTQGSPEWLQARVGSLGASQVNDALAKTKTGWGASRANVQATLIVERLTGLPSPTFINDAMRWGTETEPHARAAYAFVHDIDVEEVGLFRHPSIKGSHASPDGVIGNVGLVEIKCPNTATHIDTLLSQTIPQKYVTQMAWQMACCGPAFEYCDFVSFDPRLPSDLQLFVKRYQRDDAFIAELEREVGIFLAELEAKIDALQSLTRAKAA